MKLFNTCSRYLGLTTSLFLGIATSQPAQAATLTFESVPTLPEGTLISNQFLNDYGMTFSLVDEIFPNVLTRVGSPVLAKVGGDRAAFTRQDGAPPDTPKGTKSGQSKNGRLFITDDDGGKRPPKSLLIEYDRPVSIAKGEILDIDRQGQKEKWRVVARDSFGNELQSLNFSKNSPNTGDGVATPWKFENLRRDISSVLLEFTGTANNRIGVGFDNFFAQFAQPAPTPAPPPPPPPPPPTKLPPVYSFRFTDIKAVENDPEGDKFQLAFEVLNWSNQPAAGVRIALTEGSNTFVTDGVAPSFAGAGIDSNGRPNGPDGDPLPGNQLFINTGQVVESTDTAIQWDANQFNFNTLVSRPIPNRDLLGVGPRNTPGACALVPGCRVVGGSPNSFFGTPKVVDPETVDNGNNVLDGFVVTVDDFDEGELISFNWNLLGVDGLPIGTPNSGNEYGFGTANIVRIPIGEDPNADFRIFEQDTGVEQSERLFAEDSYLVTEYSPVAYDTTIASGLSATNALATQTVNSTGEPIAQFAAEVTTGITGAFLNPADNIFNSPVNAQLVASNPGSGGSGSGGSGSGGSGSGNSGGDGGSGSGDIQPESVPEPSTIAMLGMTAIALFGYKRQRRS
ncbi:MAG: PEP-CTERM sorting domain-containing protein [Cyanobacteriota bacterium]|nr:PEP-CTERM sorting domain-containing protein [Cyanobacteriota bacterium]